VPSGAAALLLADRPTLTPDQVKALLTSTTSPHPEPDRFAQGAGRLQLDGGGDGTAPTTVQTLSAERPGLDRRQPRQPARRRDLRRRAVEIRGEIDVRCQPWDAVALVRLALDRRRLDRRRLEGRRVDRRGVEGRGLVRRQLGRRRVEGRHLDLRQLVRRRRLDRRHDGELALDRRRVEGLVLDRRRVEGVRLDHRRVDRRGVRRARRVPRRLLGLDPEARQEVPGEPFTKAEGKRP
jgi:hypothetical protein